MKLFYYDEVPNFGDALNDWLWDRILPGKITGTGPYLSVIGTLSACRIPPAEPMIIFSSGVGYGAFPNFNDRSDITVSCLRGPLSARALNVDPSASVTDGAALLATLDDFKPIPTSKRRGIVFMPHHRTEEIGGFDRICEAAGIEYLSPLHDSRETIYRIANAELVLADAMHAAIVADTMRVPWIPIVTSPRSSAFKWLDWTLSLGMPYEPSLLWAPHSVAYLHDKLARWSGRKYFFKERSPDRALARQEEISQRHKNPRPFKRQKRLSKKLTSFINRMPADVPAADAFFFSMARRGLLTATKRRPYLSDEKIFMQRLASLEGRLVTLPTT